MTSHVVPDDPSVVAPIFQTLKKNASSSDLLSYNFRLASLRSLHLGLNSMKAQMNQALKSDLGYGEFMAGLASHGGTIKQIQYICDRLKGWMKPESVETPLALGWASCNVKYEPLGAVLVVSAWNYPIYTAIAPLAAAIAAGNTVLLKPSEMAPQSSRVLRILFEKYLNPNYYRVLEGKVEVAKSVTKLPWDLICFTGSTFTGRIVAIEAAKNLTPCILELGGKCPSIVDPTADLDSSIQRLLWGKLLNAGQTCVGVDYVYVHEAVAAEFKKRLLAKMKFAYGDIKEIQNNGDYAKIINQFHFNRLMSHLNEEHGGKVLYEGARDKDSLLMGPVVVEQPKLDSKMMNEEIFGPILPIFTYTDLKQVVSEINGRPKPLAVYMFSTDKNSINIVRDQTRSGAFVVNDAVIQMLNSGLPFGGVGHSGSGRYHGHAGFKAFSNGKSVCEVGTLNSYPLNARFPPYTESNKKVLTFILKVGSMTYSTIGRALLVLVILLVVLALWK